MTSDSSTTQPTTAEHVEAWTDEQVEAALQVREPVAGDPISGVAAALNTALKILDSMDEFIGRLTVPHGLGLDHSEMLWAQRARMAACLRVADCVRGQVECASYLYFNPGGKWKYEGQGAPVPIDGHGTTHARLLELNGGRWPGLAEGADATCYTVVVLDPHSFPRMVLALRGQP